MYPGERFNGYSHLAALLGSLGATGLLLDRALRSGDAQAVVGVAVFGACATLLYAASLMFHSTRGHAKARWARADHAAIHLMIAGSYTPFALAAAGSRAGELGQVINWRHALLAAMWLVALAGAARELKGQGRPALWLYLVLGWLGMAGAVSMAANLSCATIGWLLAGAACYTGGTVFYVNRRGWTHAHGVWHLFVMGGTACHMAAVAVCLGSP
ncbi:MAG: channel protein hemolysin family [Rhodoferax sp.]|nr:channel protein hemolysin family [Rhodoferax sp.]